MFELYLQWDPPKDPVTLSQHYVLGGNSPKVFSQLGTTMFVSDMVSIPTCCGVRLEKQSVLKAPLRPVSINL